MELKIDRETLLKPLQLIIGVVEKRQTLPILGNVLIKIDGDTLSMTATDLEIEMVTHIPLENCGIGETTFPARKFMDICKALPDGALINIKVDGERATIRSGKSRFILSTLPANDFPNIDSFEANTEFTLSQNQLKHLFDKTQFAMAQQDVRYYLNGLLLEFTQEQIRAVATDGHRLALCDEQAAVGCSETQQIIVPRKAVLELSRLLGNSDEPVTFQLGNNHIRLITSEMTFITKLIDGRFPDYQRVVPQAGDKLVTADRQTLRQALSRASILSNEKYRSVRFKFSNNTLQVLAHNPEQEEAEEDIVVEYNGEILEIGFNASYVMDALGVIGTDSIIMELTDQNSCCLIRSAESQDAKYVVMPMRL